MEMDNILFFKLWKFGSKKIKRQNMTLEYILKILSPILLLRCTETFYKVPTFLFVIMEDTVLCDSNPKLYRFFDLIFISCEPGEKFVV